MAFRERKKPKEEEMNLVPMMNLMTVLIPFLLSITAFAKIAVIEIALPKARGSQTQTQQKKKPEKKEEKLNLSILMSDQGMTIGAKGGFLPTVFTREQWKFKDEIASKYYTVDVDTNTLKEMREDRAIMVAAANKTMTIHERQEIILLATDKESPTDVGALVKTVHNPTNEMLVKLDYSPVLKSELGTGDSLINLTKYVRFKKALAAIDKLQKEVDAIDGATQPKFKADKQKELNDLEKAKNKIRYIEIVSNPATLIELPASAYDILMTRLLKVRRDFEGTPDIDEIIITCEDQIVYDKVVALIDISRIAGFSKIMLAKFRA